MSACLACGLLPAVATEVDQEFCAACLAACDAQVAPIERCRVCSTLMRARAELLDAPAPEDAQDGPLYIPVRIPRQRGPHDAPGAAAAR